MPFYIYNTVSGEKELFEPLEKDCVRIYTCGPTVYDYVHIGNLRTFLFEDILVRYLQFQGYTVKQIMNITDVDDKTIRASQQAQISLAQYTEVYTRAFFKDLETLNITPAYAYPKATDHIDDMVKLIEDLKSKGNAYESDGSTYFKVSTFENYGHLSKVNQSELQAGAGGRVTSDEYNKEHFGDFALWKAHNDHDGPVCWHTSLGVGRPGWHIECSAMSMHYLGHSFDIHTGGVDNIFPHHENEIAQSVAATGLPLARYWMHGEFLNFNDEKISKSKGNVIHLQDLLDRGHTKEAIRLSLIQAHYRSKLHYSERIIEQAESSLLHLNDFIAKLYSIQSDTAPISQDILQQAHQKFQDALNDDLNMPQALASVFETMKSLQRIFEGLGTRDAEEIVKYFTRVNQVLGVLTLSPVSLAEAINAQLTLSPKDFAYARTQLMQALQWQDLEKLPTQYTLAEESLSTVFYTKYQKLCSGFAVWYLSGQREEALESYREFEAQLIRLIQDIQESLQHVIHQASPEQQRCLQKAEEEFSHRVREQQNLSWLLLLSVHSSPTTMQDLRQCEGFRILLEQATQDPSFNQALQKVQKRSAGLTSRDSWGWLRFTLWHIARMDRIQNHLGAHNPLARRILDRTTSMFIEGHLHLLNPSYTELLNTLKAEDQKDLPRELLRQGTPTKSHTAEGFPELHEIKDFCIQRGKAKQSKNYAQADHLRLELKKRGVTLEDTHKGLRIIHEFSKGSSVHVPDL